ncbi:MAG TPA: hypothetical protein VGD61_16300 [Pyrinomonadaceae bacterium]
MSDSPIKTGAKWQDHETLGVVRPMVRELLLGVPAFRQLNPEEQQQIAGKMVHVASYLANPDGVITESMEKAAPPAEVVARAQADDPVDATKKRLSQAPGQVGKGFQAGAVREGVEQFGELVQKVDFPEFVGGLIKNVFQAIVDSSIQQMQAYGELLANVAKTVDQYARDNISENNSRDWLANKYPDALGVEIGNVSGELAEGSDAPQQTAKLTTTGDDPQAALTKISQDLAHLMPRPVTDLSDPAEEARLVQAARLEIARGRQQLLASMVMLGINRIVVTDGLIHAKVIFDMRASDTAGRHARASMVDQQKSSLKTDAKLSYGGWFSPWKGSMGIHTSNEHTATVQSSVDDTSESKAEVKAKLSGEVRVNFKSDYFPMDKMASPQMIAAIQGNAQPPEKAITGV